MFSSVRPLWRSLQSVMIHGWFSLAIAGWGIPLLCGSADAASSSTKQQIDRGRYLIIVARCNDCHTAGYADAAGKIPEQDELTEDRIGWRDPWGTTYATNLRLSIKRLTEEQWLTVARTVEFRPPMPWYILREMTDEDLRALYRFIKNLGPAGEPAPSFVPPDQGATKTLYPFSREPLVQIPTSNNVGWVRTSLLVALAHEMQRPLASKILRPDDVIPLDGRPPNSLGFLRVAASPQPDNSPDN